MHSGTAVDVASHLFCLSNTDISLSTPGNEREESPEAWQVSRKAGLYLRQPVSSMEPGQLDRMHSQELSKDPLQMAGKFLYFIWCLGINETKMFSTEPLINEILYEPIDLQPPLRICSR